jgi:hypothetical protein
LKPEAPETCSLTDQIHVQPEGPTERLFHDPEGSKSDKGIGSSSSPSAIIQKVRYVPGLGTNLFSIAAATDPGWKMTFVSTQVHLTSEQDVSTMVRKPVGRTLYN